MLRALARGASFADTARLAGIDVTTFIRWRRRGESEASGEFYQFCQELQRVRAKRRKWYRDQIRRIGIATNNYRPILWLASVTEPEEFSQKHRATVERELGSAIERLKAAFSDEPELLERVFLALIGR